MNEIDRLDDCEIVDEPIEERIPYKYSITSYGADFPVDSIVSRLEKGVILIPAFQRNYVWSLATASRFIESLLLGLPVPGVFLAKEQDSEKMLVIDGLQRLKTLQFFYNGLIRGKEFKLLNVESNFERKSYKSLDEDDRLRLDNSIIHATIVKQDEPSDDQSSVFHIFERLNTGGMLLQAQEIRACIFHGELNDFLSSLNEYKYWRNIFGKLHSRLKDQELILRYFALYFSFDKYERPMKEFLNTYMGANKNIKLHDKEILTDKFTKAIDIIATTLGNKAFRLERALNAAVFDAVMVGLTRRLDKGPIEDKSIFVSQYNLLLKDEEFCNACKTATSDASNVTKRIGRATTYFESIL